MYVGEYALGESVPLLLKTKDANGVPTEPVDCPSLVVWLGATDVERGELPVIERRTFPGTFFLSLFLGSAYIAGNYCAEFRWVLPSGYIGSAEATFSILAGGHADGSVVAQYYFNRPHSAFLVHECESGQILPGKNPSL
jgi:hypothetical protein